MDEKEGFKRRSNNITMNDSVVARIDSMDRISQLPEPIIHRIISCLSYSEGFRTIILSKTWQTARESYPFLLYYNERLFLGLDSQTTPITEIKHRSFMDMVEDSILKLHKRGCTLEIFHLGMMLLYGCGSRVERWLEVAIEMKVKELFLEFEVDKNEATTSYCLHRNLSQIIFGSKSLTSLWLTNCNMTNLLISTRCGFLQELILHDVYVTEDILQMIIFCCSSSLVNLTLSCKLLKSLHISNVKKLEKVTVYDYKGELERIEIKAPSLGSFAYYGLRRTFDICLAACVNLQELYIDCPLIPEQFSRDVGSRFPHLKIFELHGYGLKRFEISSLRLERLWLVVESPVSEAIIEAPNLSSFVLDGDLTTILSFSIEIPRECEIRLASPQNIDTLWFLKLKECVTKLGVENMVFCTAIFCSKITFSLEDLRNISIPPPCHVKHLKLDARSYHVKVLNLDALVDGLLWSFRPETISTAKAPVYGTCRKFAKVLCEKLVSRKSRQRCCGSSPVSCWLHCLKDVKIVLFAGTDEKALDCHSLLQALPTLTNHHHISFKLSW